MTNRAVLIQEIDRLPAQYIAKIYDFVSYLQQQANNADADNDEVSAYQAMAADTEREQEAREWCNAYFGPARQ